MNLGIAFLLISKFIIEIRKFTDEFEWLLKSHKTLILIS